MCYAYMFLVFGTVFLGVPGFFLIKFVLLKSSGVRHSEKIESFLGGLTY